MNQVSTPMYLEVESKLAIADSSGVEDFLSSGALGDCRVGPGRSARVLDYYLDTPDWQIYKAGYALRLRREDRVTFLNLKTLNKNGSAALHQRGEIRQAVTPREASNLNLPGSGPVTSRLAVLVNGQPLRQLFAIKTQQRRFPVADDPADQPKAEISLDRCSVLIDRREVDHFDELEIEMLAGGTPDSVHELSLKIADACVLVPLEATKFERALAISGLEPSDAEKALDTHISHDTPARVAVCAIIQRQLTRALAHEARVVAEGTAQAIHDMRVAVRRARTYLSLFSAALPAQGTSVLKRDLRWLGDQLGAVRDIDVQLERIEGRKKAPAAAERYRRYLGVRREAAYARLLKALGSRHYEQLLSRGAALLKVPGQLRVHDQRLAFESFLARIAIQTLDRVSKDGNRVNTSSLRALHRKRIRAKHARYCLEAGRPILPRYTRQAIESLVGIQDYLGDLQNAVVGRRMLEAFSTSRNSGLTRQGLIDVGRMLAKEEQQIATLRSGAGEQFRKLSQSSPLKRIRQRLARQRKPAKT